MDKAVQVVKAKSAGLSPQMRLAAAMIATGSTDVEVAAEVKVATSTVATWRKKQPMVDEINRCCTQLQATVIRRASALLPLAIEAVEDVLRMPSSSATTTANLQAAKIVFSRLPANVLALEPAPDAPVPTAEELAERNTVPKATLLDVVRELRAIEEARRRLPVGLPETYYDDRDDDEDQGDEQDDGRTIVGEVVHDVADEPTAEQIESPVAPVVPLVNPAVGGTPVPAAEMERQLRALGGSGPFQSRRIR
jgi:hypothetical protein